PGRLWRPGGRPEFKPDADSDRHGVGNEWALPCGSVAGPARGRRYRSPDADGHRPDRLRDRLRPDAPYLGGGQPAPARLAAAGAGDHVHGDRSKGAGRRRHSDVHRGLADLEHAGARFLHPPRPLPCGPSAGRRGTRGGESGTADDPDSELANWRRESRIIRRLLMATMENDKVVYLTQEGLNRLQAELEVLRNKRRPEVAERIRQAKEFGDINENAEYDDAKNEQGFVEGRILLLEKRVGDDVSVLTPAGSTKMLIVEVR